MTDNKDPAPLLALSDTAINTAITTLIVSCRPAGNVDVDDAAEIRDAVALLRQARDEISKNGTLSDLMAELPNLPRGRNKYCVCGATSNGYTADQMRAYATEAAAYYKEMHRSLLTAYNELLAAKGDSLDAARYRAMRAASVFENSVFLDSLLPEDEPYPSTEVEFDARVDAAMNEGSEVRS